jgi:hypothetical protein
MAKRQIMAGLLATGLMVPMAAWAGDGHSRVRTRHEVQQSERVTTTIKPENRPTRASTLMHVNTSMVSPAAEGCEYAVTAKGRYRSQDRLGIHRDVPLENVDIQANTELKCGESVVRTERHRFVLPTATADELEELLTERLRVTVPNSNCAWTPHLRLEAGNLQAQGISSNCAYGEAQAALSFYSDPEAEEWDEFSEELYRGGGPGAEMDQDDFDREPTSDDARYGTR